MCVLAQWDYKIAYYFGNNERNWLSFGIRYDFVAQKWNILTIFYKNNPFWENYLEVIGI